PKDDNDKPGPSPMSTGSIGDTNQKIQDRSALESELERWQGTWYHISREVNGKQVIGEVKDLKFIISGDKVSMKRGDKVFQRGNLKLIDASASPKTFDLTITE